MPGENSGNKAVRKSSASKSNTPNTLTEILRLGKYVVKAGSFVVDLLTANSGGKSNPLTNTKVPTKALVPAPTKPESGREHMARKEAASAVANELKGNTQPFNYYFNLPPHQWSLPVRPVDVNSLNQKKTITELGADVDFFAPTEVQQISAFHGFRRGRIWRFQGLNYDLESASGDKTTGSGTTTGQKSKESNLRPLSVDQWGFQFLWNPDSINISVNLNMEVTPSANDIFRSVVGAFPGMEYISVKIMIDRTNDFACFKATKEEDLKNFERYYLNRYPYEYKQDVKKQITDLSRLGTGADLEYLFKTLNGSGSDKDWTNLIGKPTADIGFIQPAIIAIQLGPTMDSLSYVGWVESLSISHISFTESMIPLRTEINFSMRTITGSTVRS
jgi:hypothetical protein